MPSPNTVFTEMVTTTLRNHPSDVTDNVTKNNALLRRLKKNKNIKTKSGGYEIVIPLEYAENGTYQRYSGYDTLNVSASDVLTSAKFDWQQIAIHVTSSGREVRMNNSKEAMIDLVEARIKSAKNTASNNMSIDIYSDGALANQINGLKALITTDGNGTVGGINAANYAFWQNKQQDHVGTPGPTTILGNMNTLWLKLVRGDDMPDLCLFTHDFYSFYEGALQPNQRYMSADSAAAGFEALKYKSADVIFDDNANFGTTAELGYFLNTKYLYLIQHSEAQFSQEEGKKPVNQDAIVVPMFWMGNMAVANRALQGLLHDTVNG